MSDSVAAAQVVADVKVKTPKKKASTAKAVKKPTDHPKYIEMVQQALGSLKERGGSSRQAILKYIVKNFKVGNDENVVNTHVKMALRAGVKNASLKQSKGTGAAGSFRLGEEAKKPKAVKKPKAAAAAKKPAAKAKSATGVKSPKKVVKKTTAAAAKKPKADKPVKKAKADKPKKAATPKKAAAKVAAPKKAAAAAPKKATKADKPKKAASPAKKVKPAAAKKTAAPKAKKPAAAKKA
jgi:histone H1/5